MATVGIRESLEAPTNRTDFIDREYLRALLAGRASIVLARLTLDPKTSNVSFADFIQPDHFQLASDPAKLPIITLRDAVTHRASHVSESFTLLSKISKVSKLPNASLPEIYSAASSSLPPRLLSFGAGSKFDYHIADITAANTALGRLKQRGLDFDLLAKWRNELAHEVHYRNYDLFYADVMVVTGQLETARVAIEGELNDLSYVPQLKRANPDVAALEMKIATPRAMTKAEHQALIDAAANNDDLL